MAHGGMEKWKTLICNLIDFEKFGVRVAFHFSLGAEAGFQALDHQR